MFRSNRWVVILLIGLVGLISTPALSLAQTLPGLDCTPRLIGQRVECVNPEGQQAWNLPVTQDLLVEATRLAEHAGVSPEHRQALDGLVGEAMYQGLETGALDDLMGHLVVSQDSWQDLIFLGHLVDEMVTAEVMAEIQRAGQDGLKAMGVDLDSLEVLVPILAALADDNPDLAALLAALEAGDLFEAMRLGQAVARSLPDLATLTQRWDQMVAANEEETLQIAAEITTELDRAVWILGSLVIALLLIAALSGLRMGRLRRLALQDLAVPLMIYLTLVAGIFYLNHHLHVATELAEIPVADLQRGATSSESQQWLRELAELPEIQQMATELLRPRDHVVEPSEAPPIVRVLVDQAYADARAAQVEMARSFQVPDLIATAAMVQRPPETWEILPGKNAAWALAPLVALLILVLVFVAMGRIAAPLARIVQWLPGGPTRYSPLASLSLLALILGASSVFGLDQLVRHQVMLHGAEALDTEALSLLLSSPDHRIGWALIALGVLVHLALIPLQRQPASTSK